MHLFLAAMKPFPQRSPDSVAHLRRLSRCMVWLSRALMVLLPLGLLGVWAWTPPAGSGCPAIRSPRNQVASESNGAG